MKVKEGDLVLVRLVNDPMIMDIQPHYNIWVRVNRVFSPSHNGVESSNLYLFRGIIERKDQSFNYDVGHTIELPTYKILDIFNEKDGKQWCYSDDVTRCSCPGLCRNK